jgi:hypothetical protein
MCKGFSDFIGDKTRALEYAMAESIDVNDDIFLESTTSSDLDISIILQELERKKMFLICLKPQNTL